MISGLKTHEVMARLRERFKAPEYAFFGEVPNATGYGSRRWADGIAMGLWPSRGLYLTGFEVKCSRQDWAKELKNPAKADLIAQYCDYWYLVLGDPGIIHKGELPLTWGLLLPTEKGLRIAKEPERLDPAPITRQFLASILRRGHESDSINKQIEAAVSKAKTESYDRGKADGRRDANFQFPRLEKELADLKIVIQKFSEASGIDLMKETWRENYPVRMGEIVKLILDDGIPEQMERLKWIKDSANRIVKSIDELETIVG